jgi:hypothetical protein
MTLLPLSARGRAPRRRRCSRPGIHRSVQPNAQITPVRQSLLAIALAKPSEPDLHTGTLEVLPLIGRVFVLSHPLPRLDAAKTTRRINGDAHEQLRRFPIRFLLPRRRLLLLLLLLLLLVLELEASSDQFHHPHPHELLLLLLLLLLLVWMRSVNCTGHGRSKLISAPLELSVSCTVGEKTGRSLPLPVNSMGP